MIEHIAIISLIVLAIWYTMQDGEIFGRLGNWLSITAPSWIQNPLYDCPVCMVPYYGAVVCLILGWPVWLVIPAMGLNVIIVKVWRHDD